MGQQYYTLQDGRKRVILHIYGARAIFLTFCVHQNTESEAQKTEIGVVGPILTQKKYQRLYGTNISIFYKT